MGMDERESRSRAVRCGTTFMRAETDDQKIRYRAQPREITLKDGRYMIFYTFADESAKDSSAEANEAVSPAEPEDEKNV